MTPGFELVERKLFSKRTINPNGCWIFTESKDKDGYGLVKFGLKTWRVHVLAYTAFIGPPENCVCHKPKCHDRACFNPDHLYDGTRQTNAKDRKRGTYRRNLDGPDRNSSSRSRT